MKCILIVLALLPLYSYSQMNQKDSTRYKNISERLNYLNTIDLKKQFTTDLIRDNKELHEDLDSADHCIKKNELNEAFLILSQAKFHNDMCVYSIKEIKKCKKYIDSVNKIK